MPKFIPPHVIASRTAAARELLAGTRRRARKPSEPAIAIDTAALAKKLHAAAQRLEPRGAKTKKGAPSEIRLDPQAYVSGPEDGKPPITESEFGKTIRVYSNAIAFGAPDAPSAKGVFEKLGEQIVIKHDGQDVGLIVDLELSAQEDGVISGKVQLSDDGKLAVKLALPGLTWLVPVLAEGAIAYVDLDAPPTSDASAASARAIRREQLGDNAADLLMRLNWR